MPTKKGATSTPYDQLVQALAAAEQLHVELTIVAGSLPPAIGEDAVIGAIRHLERAICGLHRVRETIDAWTGRQTPASQALSIAKGGS